MTSTAAGTALVRKPTAARPPTIRYLGFECTSEGRSYRLSVDSGRDDRRFYTVTVLTAAFATRRARFQDAPELCLNRLQRELDANTDLPGETPLVITSDDLDAYRESQTRRSPDRKSRGTHPAR